MPKHLKSGWGQDFPVEVFLLFHGPHFIPNLFNFISYVEHKIRYFGECGRTKQLLVPIDFYREWNTMEVNGDHQLFDYQNSSKYILLCST